MSAYFAAKTSKISWCGKCRPILPYEQGSLLRGLASASRSLNSMAECYVYTRVVQTWLVMVAGPEPRSPMRMTSPGKV